MFARRVLRTLPVALPLALAAFAAGCTQAVDVKEAISIVDAQGGWYDAGIKDGKNKIVPSVTFRLRKKPDADIRGVALNVVFRHPPAAGTDAEEDWDEVFLQNAEFEGDQSQLLTVRPEKGYTGDPPQTRLEIMKHSGFRDVHARIYAKHSSTQWVDIGTIDVPRQLITRQ
jgi:hypothetical protein